MTQIDAQKLEQYAEKIFDRLNYFNDYTLQTIGRRIKAIGKLSAHDQQALKNMADISGDMKAITKKLAEVTGQNIRDIEKIYTQTTADGADSYKPLYDFKKMEFVPFEQNDFAQQLVRHWAEETTGEMINLSRTKALCFDQYNLAGEVIGATPLEGAFQKAIDDAIIAVSDGTTDFNTAMRETVKNLGGSGIKVHYGSGVNRSLSAMVRQNLLYGVKRAAQAYDAHIGQELACDGFEVDAHSGCRPSHEFMQGQTYSYNGDKTVNGITYKDGTAALKALGDYGCLHFKTDVILGVSEPRYSKEELARIHRETTELLEYDGRKKTLYEWKQTQRRLERAVRNETDIRNMAEAAGDRVLARDCNAKIRAYREKYDDMCEKVGLETKYERMRTYMGSSAKIVDNGGKSGIIKVGSEAMYRKSRNDKIEPMPKKQLHRIKKSFKAKGGIFQYDDKTDEYLKSKNAEAVTYDSRTILLRKNPGRASVYEELIHATQYRNGENDGSYKSRLKCEIAAQEKLLKYSKAYKLTNKEIEQTKKALELYQAELDAYIK